MNQRLLLLWVAYGLVLIGVVADLAYHYPRLPERVAVHFNAAGTPDGWGPKAGLWTSHLVLPLFMGGLFAGLRLLVQYLPARFINMPRREYWLAPERGEETRRDVGDLVLELGLVLLVKVACLNHVTLRANLASPPGLGAWPWIIVGVGLAAIAALLILRLRKYYRGG